MLAHRSAATAESQPAAEYVDERLLGEPKSHTQKGRMGRTPPWLTWLAVIVFCYTVSLQEQLFALLTSVRCYPETVLAGANATCTITTFFLAAEADLSITQLGAAGPVALLGAQPHRYDVSFSTATAGGAGVRVQHALVSSWSLIEVLPAPAAGKVEVSCAPQRVRPGQEVRCTVVPRDRFGNEADVEKPADAPASFFSVTRTGGAGELTVHDTYVAFAAGAEPGRAGVAVTLGGVRVEASVEVEKPS